MGKPFCTLIELGGGGPNSLRVSGLGRIPGESFEIVAREMLRSKWWVFATTLFIGLVVAVAVRFVVWDWIAEYIAGAILISSVWGCYVILVSGDGLAGRRAGIMGEEWTADELRKLRRHGWRVVNHVMLEYGDIDHAVLGPGGFFSIETKYRSDWGRGETEMDSMVGDAVGQARRLQSRIGTRDPKVEPLVVVWGPKLAESFPEPLTRGGVVFCPGNRIKAYLLDRGSGTETRTVEVAFAELEAYVEKRDRGERDAYGDPVENHERSHLQSQCCDAGGRGHPARDHIPRESAAGGLWSVAFRGGGRRAWSPTSPIRGRVRLGPAATASMVVAAGMGSLLLAVLIINLFA